MALIQHSAAETVVWTLGDHMYKARKQAKLEQKDIADRIGVSRALVSRWENDLSEPSYRRLVKFAEVTNFPLDVLLSAIGYISDDAGEPPDLSVIPGQGKGKGRGLPMFVPSI